MLNTVIFLNDLSILMHRPEEEVILKIFKQNESMQNMYLAVYLPRHRTGYPRYYIPKTTSQPSYGNIPGMSYNVPGDVISL